MENENLEHEVVKISEKKWRWMSKRDTKSLGALFHDESIFVHMGATMSKDEELDTIRSGRIQYQDVDVQEVSVRFIGETAILWNKIRLVALVNGNEAINPFAVTEVYVRQGGEWTLASLSFTRLINT